MRILVPPQKFVLLAFLVLFASAFGQQQNVSIAVPSQSMNYLNVFLAEEFLEAEGLSAEITAVQGGSRAAAALAGGGADFAVLAVNELVNIVAHGQNIVAVAGLQNGNAIQVVVDSEVLEERDVSPSDSFEDRIRALEGLNIGVTTPGSSTDQTLRYLLAQIDMPDTNLNIVNLNNPAAMLAALGRGQIDGFVHAPPNTTEAVVSHGAVVLIDMIDAPATQGALFHVLTVRPQWAEQNEETVLAVLRGFWNMMHFMAEEPEAAQEAARAIYAETEAELFRNAFEAMYASYAPTPLMDADSAQRTVSYLEATSGEQVDAAPPEVWIDNSYAERARPSEGQ